MSEPIADYALLSDCHGAGLVCKNGSLDWLCVPRFDSRPCFSALLGKPEHGRWLIAPQAEVRRVSRKYRGESLVLETELETEDGIVALIDFMPPSSERVDVVRLVEGRKGKVRMHTELTLRFDYGKIEPWVKRCDHSIEAIAGPDRLQVRTPIPLEIGESTTGSFDVAAGQRVPFVITFHPSHLPAPAGIDVELSLSRTEAWWRKWAERTTYAGRWQEAVRRSLLVLKGLTYKPTGGIVAAATTSLPEKLGGVRNWDYRICWLRDATITLHTLVANGYAREAEQWREWLLRAVAGKPSQIQIMYGLAGERRLTECDIPWLPGYADSRPVREGNAAFDQRQLDVFGELLDAMHQCRQAGLENQDGWQLERNLLDFLEGHWQCPDKGIWEVRGGRQQFTHSKIMAWVAFDRAIQAVERFERDGPVEHWRKLRDRIHRDVCEKGYNPQKNAFVQTYGSDRLDASLLLIPMVGFLPVTDARVRGTIEAIERELVWEGCFVKRYITHSGIDGLPAGEGSFLACSFWLLENLAMLGRRKEAEERFERLLQIRNDVGLLAEEYDPQTGLLLGNFPQAFSHVALIDCAMTLTRSEEKPNGHRHSTEFG